MNILIIATLLLILLVSVYIAIKLSISIKINEKIVELFKEQNILLKSLYGTNNQKIKKQNYRQKPKEKAPSQLKTFTAKEVTIRRKNGKKTERLSMEQWKKKRKIYGKDAYEIIEYHG